MNSRHNPSLSQDYL